MKQLFIQISKYVRSEAKGGFKLIGSNDGYVRRAVVYATVHMPTRTG